MWNVLCFNFYLLNRRETDRKKTKTKPKKKHQIKETFHLLAHSLNAHNGQDCAGSKLRAGNSIHISHTGIIREPKYLSHKCCQPGVREAKCPFHVLISITGVQLVSECHHFLTETTMPASEQQYALDCGFLACYLKNQSSH